MTEHKPLSQAERNLWRASVLNNPIMDRHTRTDMLRLLDNLDAAEKREAQLREAVLNVIELDRLIGGKSQEDATKIELLEGDSVLVADLLRGMGLPIGDYP